MKTKIAIIDSVAARGGSHHFYLFGQAMGLINEGVEVGLFTNDLTEDPKIEGLKIKHYYRGIFGRKSNITAGILYVFGSIRSIIGAKYFGAKICHYHLFHVNMLVVFDLIFSKMMGLKVVYTVHDVVSNLDKTKSSNKLIDFVLRQADKLITHNEFSRNQMLDLFKGIDKDVAVIPHGNYLPFIKAEKEQDSSRDYLGIPKEKKVLLFFGMIKRIKGLEILLNSLAEVKIVHPDIVLLIAGKSWEDDFNVYQKIIDREGLNKNCIIHNKYIPSEDVAHYFCSADLSVLPYKRISQSGVLMMAMSYNSAVLTSDLLPFTELITDNETGFLFESENVKSLSDKIISVFKDEDSVSKVRKKGMDLIKTEYNWNRLGSLSKKIYQSL
jgi:D-inositol-3-phosphate glycosyltransferase